MHPVPSRCLLWPSDGSPGWPAGFGKCAALDFIVSIIVGSSVSRAIIGSAALGGTPASTTLIMLLHWVLAHAAGRSDRLLKIVEGAPLPLVRDKVNPSASLRGSISRRDLEEALRLRRRAYRSCWSQAAKSQF